MDAGAQERVRAAAAEVGDWERAVALTLSHRVEGLVGNAIRSAGVEPPGPAAARFEAAAERVRVDGLRSVAETLRVCRDVAKAGIPFMVLKGLPVAMLAYGTPTIKHSIDLDLLVHPEDVVRTAALLAEIDYQCLRPPRPLTAREFEAWGPVAKEAWLVSPRGQVDLHWDLADQPALLDRLEPWRDARSVDLLPGHPVPTLRDGANLAYLAVHGAMSGWSRLKWIADFSAFLAVHPLEEQERLCAEARVYTGGRPVDQALILAERLLGPDLVPAVQRRDRPTLVLADLAQRIIAAREPGRVLEAQTRAWTLIGRSQWLLRSGWSYRRSEFKRRMMEQEIRLRLRWPVGRGLQWIYWPLRLPGGLFGWAYRRLRRVPTEL